MSLRTCPDYFGKAIPHYIARTIYEVLGLLRASTHPALPLLPLPVGRRNERFHFIEFGVQMF
jgi:hypothetical protein